MFLTFVLTLFGLVLLSQSGNKRIQLLSNKKNLLSTSLFKSKKGRLDSEWLEELAAKLQSGAPARVALRNSLEKTALLSTKNACQNGSSISAALLIDNQTMM